MLMKRACCMAALLLPLMVAALCWIAGGQRVAPVQSRIGPPPADLQAQAVRIERVSGPPVHGWWVAAERPQAAILLLHGIRSNRLSMLSRARALSARGYAVLLIDLPAHGESAGPAITLGLRESAAVVAARDWMRQQLPAVRLGVIGVSLGGASLLLGPQPCGFDAVVLESVYADVHRAIDNRLAMRVGAASWLLTPLLEWQLYPRLGIRAEALRPIDHIGRLDAPVLLVAGSEDRHTTLAETQQMLARAAAPRRLWVVKGAAHVDFFDRQPADYARHVFTFLDQYLAGP